MSWHDHVTFSDDYRLLYKGVDIGISREFVFDLQAQTGMDLDDNTVESMYNSTLCVRRDKILDDILS